MRAIVGAATRNLDARHDVGSRPDHNMRLDPLGFRHFAPVFLVKPPLVNRGREPGRIGGKIFFDSAEGAGALLNERLENRRHLVVFEDAKDRVVVRGLVDITAIGKLLQVNHRATAGRAAIDLHNGAKDGVRERDARATVFMDWIVDSGAEAVQQPSNAFLLDGLRGVVRGPILPVRYAHRLFEGNVALFVHRVANRVLNGVQVFALDAMRFKVWTSAVRPLRSRLDDVGSAARLRGHHPERTLLLEGLGLGESNAARFPGFHTSSLLQGKPLVNPVGANLTVITARYILRICLESRYGVTAASGAGTNGSLAIQTRSRKSVRNVKAPIGIHLAAHNSIARVTV